MKNSGVHPSREEMLTALETGSISFSSHLQKCEPCRSFFELLSRFGVGSTLPFVEPSRSSIWKAVAIPRLVDSRVPAKTVLGAVTFDSWAQLPAVELRDIETGFERRIRFEAAGIVLELVAERQRDTWDFVARAYHDQAVTSEFVLKVGRNKLFTQAQKCFFWKSKHLPRKIQLLSSSLRVDLGELTWKSAVSK